MFLQTTAEAESLKKSTAAQRPLGNKTRLPDRSHEQRTFLDDAIEDAPKTQSLVRTMRWKLTEAAGDLLPGTSIARCRKWILRKKGESQEEWLQKKGIVCKGKESGSVFFGNLATCGSRWGCPQCGAILTETSRKELRVIEIEWKQRGGELRLLTLTIPHNSRDSLKYLWDGFIESLKTFFDDRVFRDWKERVGLQHRVRALELTDGEAEIDNRIVWTGYHLHAHILLLLMPGPDTIEPRAEDLLPLWQSRCLAAGREKPNIHGLHIGDRNVASTYVAKWGLDCEMAYTFSKRGRQGHFTPRDWLIDFTENRKSDDEAIREHAERSGAKYREFYHVSKGKQQLRYTTNLRKDLGLEPEKTDRQIMDSKKEDSEIVGFVDRCELSLLVRGHARGLFLEIVRFEGWAKGQEFLKQVAKDLYKLGRSWRTLHDMRPQ